MCEITVGKLKEKKIINEQANETNELYSSIAYIYVRWCERSVEEEVSKKKTEEEGIIHTPHIHIEYIYIYIDYIR